MRKFILFKLLLLVVLLFPSLAFAQGGSLFSGGITVLSATGRPIGGATITVCAFGATGIPCSPTITIYNSPTLSTPCNGINGCGNPGTTDGNGNFFAYASPGRYTYTVTGTGITGTSLTATVAGSGGGNGDVLLGGNNAFTGNNTHSGTETNKNLNGIQFTSQQAGADLGAQLTNAAAACLIQPCLVYVDVPGTFSTVPNVPIGSTVSFAPGSYTLAITFPINHRGVVWNFNGATFSYNQDTGNPAVLTGKNLSGTANTQNAATGGCTANCVTQASGSTFTNFDTGDVIVINAVSYNVASVQSSSVLTVTSAPGTQSGVAFAGFMQTGTGIGLYTNSVVLRDLNLNYSGAGTNASNAGFKFVVVNDVLGENLSAVNFTGGYGFWGLGLQVSQFNNLRSNNNKNGIVLDQITIAGQSFASNANQFNSPQLNASPAGGTPLLIQTNSNVNTFTACDFEGNAATIFGTISSNRNTFQYCDHERNGDGTGSAADYSVSGSGNKFIGNQFTSNQANRPATGIIVGNASVDTDLQDNVWFSGASYTTAWNFTGGATGSLRNNDAGGFAHGDPPFGITDPAGNFTGRQFNFQSLITGEQTSPGGAAAAVDICYGDSTAHALKCSYNNGSFFNLPLVGIANTWTAAQTHTGAAIVPDQAFGITGTTTNNNVNAGAVGEYIQSVLATGSSVTLATGVTSNVTSISLTAGDWDVTGAVDFTFGATTSYTNLIGSVSTTTGTIGGQDSKFDFETPAAVPTAGADAVFSVPVVRFSLSGTTTVFLVAQGTFTVSTLKAYGTIRARRIR